MFHLFKKFRKASSTLDVGLSSLSLNKFSESEHCITEDRDGEISVGIGIAERGAEIFAENNSLIVHIYGSRNSGKSLLADIFLNFFNASVVDKNDIPQRDRMELENKKNAADEALVKKDIRIGTGEIVPFYFLKSRCDIATYGIDNKNAIIIISECDVEDFDCADIIVKIARNNECPGKGWWIKQRQKQSHPSPGVKI